MGQGNSALIVFMGSIKVYGPNQIYGFNQNYYKFRKIFSYFCHGLAVAESRLRAFFRFLRLFSIFFNNFTNFRAKILTGPVNFETLIGSIKTTRAGNSLNHKILASTPLHQHEHSQWPCFYISITSTK